MHTACERYPFDNANYFIDFWFILSGFFALKAFGNLDETKPLRSAWQLIKSRLTKMGLPLLFSYVAVLFNNSHFKEFKLLTHYLWFIFYLLLFEAIYFVIYSLCKKNKKIFYKITTLIVIGCFIVFYSIMIKETPFTAMIYYSDVIRAPLYIGIGILLSLVPKIKDTISQKSLTIMFFYCLFISLGTIFISVKNFESKIWIESACNLFLFPSLIYLGTQIDYNNKIIDGFGQAALYLYIYQPVADVFFNFGELRYGYRIIIVICLSIITMIIKKIGEGTQENYGK